MLQKVKALIGSSRLACALLLLALVVAPIASIASMTRQASRMVAADVMPCHGAAMADTGVQTGHGQAQEASAGVAKFMAHNCHCSPYCMFAVMNVADGVQTASPVSQSVVPFKPSSIAVASVDPPRATAGLRPVSPRRLRAADERIFSLRPAELQLS